MRENVTGHVAASPLTLGVRANLADARHPTKGGGDIVFLEEETVTTDDVVMGASHVLARRSRFATCGTGTRGVRPKTYLCEAER